MEKCFAAIRAYKFFIGNNCYINIFVITCKIYVDAFRDCKCIHYSILSNYIFFLIKISLAAVSWKFSDALCGNY